MASYLTVAGIGTVELADRRWVSTAILAVAVLVSVALPPLDPHAAFAVRFAGAGARFAIMFAAAALLYQWRAVIPARWWLAGFVAVIGYRAQGSRPDGFVSCGHMPPLPN